MAQEQTAHLPTPHPPVPTAWQNSQPLADSEHDHHSATHCRNWCRRRLASGLAYGPAGCRYRVKVDSRPARVEMCFERQRRMVSVKELISMKKGSMFQSSVASESKGYSTDFQTFCPGNIVGFDLLISMFKAMSNGRSFKSCSKVTNVSWTNSLFVLPLYPLEL